MVTMVSNSTQAVVAWLVARLGIKNERGATAVEYAVMVALIAAVIILAVIFLGRTASQTYSQTGTCLSTSGTGTGC
jgi:pilus assembly protein Flp/PilA